jgi:hypothetical protein
MPWSRVDAERDAAALLASLGRVYSAEEIEGLADTMELGSKGVEGSEAQMRALAAELRRRALQLRNLTTAR